MQNSIKAIILVVLKTNSFVQKYKYFYLYGIIFCIKTCPGFIGNALYYNVLPVYARTKICPWFYGIEICIQFCGFHLPLFQNPFSLLVSHSHRIAVKVLCKALVFLCSQAVAIAMGKILDACNILMLS